MLWQRLWPSTEILFLFTACLQIEISIEVQDYPNQSCPNQSENCIVLKIAQFKNCIERSIVFQVSFVTEHFISVYLLFGPPCTFVYQIMQTQNIVHIMLQKSKYWMIYASIYKRQLFQNLLVEENLIKEINKYLL